jgi:hypothetical protein
MSMNPVTLECRMGISEFHLPIVVLANKTLLPESKLLFAMILNISGETGLYNCKTSNEEFTDILGIASEIVEKAIDQLCEQEYIIKDEGVGKKRILKTNPNYSTKHFKIFNYFNLKYVWEEI